MYFDSLASAFTMDGHGLYVWTAYLVAIAVIVIMLIAPVLRRKRLLRVLAGEFKRAQSPAVRHRGGER
jgi:heme exporter protein D